jgi:hypothetical protein
MRLDAPGAKPEIIYVVIKIVLPATSCGSA